MLACRRLVVCSFLRHTGFRNMPNGVKRTRQEMPSTTSAMLNEGDFEGLISDMVQYDEKREKIIKTSRDVQKLAKQAIFSLLRKETSQAVKKLETAEGIAKELLPLIAEHPTLRPGSYSNSMEEYAEAMCLKVYLEEGRLITSKELPLVDRDEYLGGVLDFTGELNRFAIQRATVRDTAAVERCRDLVEAIMGQFLKMDLRNGSIRKKYDALKYTLKKLENTLYELSLMAATGRKEVGSAEDEMGGGKVEDADDNPDH